MKQLQGLLAFVEAATAGSLSAAAQRLDVTPAAVSKNLARLEAQLGVRLLQRSTRSLTLTHEGERFLEAARGALRALDDAVADVSQAARSPAGRVRMTVGAAFGRRWVLPALPRLLERHPELRIELDLDNRPVDLVASGHDIGIFGGHVPDSSLVARPICRLPLVLVASPAYLRRAGVPASPADLAAHACIGVRLSGGGVRPWFFRPRGKPKGALDEMRPEARLTLDEPEAVVDPVLAGGGIAQLALQHALPYLRSGRLKLLLTDWHDAGQREYVLHYPHRQFLAPRVRVVVEALLEAFRAAEDLHRTPADVVAALPGCVAA
jgi:DNA-binding transcriptional LysR family regulator